MGEAWGQAVEPHVGAQLQSALAVAKGPSPFSLFFFLFPLFYFLSSNRAEQGRRQAQRAGPWEGRRQTNIVSA